MTDRPPDCTGYSWASDGALTVTWAVDTFFGDSSDPNDVSVEINNAPYKQHLGSDAQSTDIPAADVEKLLPASSFAVTVVFEWTDDMQRSSVIVPLAGGTPVGSSSFPAPTLKVVAIQPKTMQTQNQITISWAGFSYTDGTITWGPLQGQSPTRISKSFKPGSKHGEPDYTGSYTTDPLPPNLLIWFNVEVVNKFQGDTASSSIAARSANNFHSVRAFLAASGIHSPASVRGAIGRGGSLRGEMGI